MGFIDRTRLRELGERLAKSGYGKYILSIVEEER